LQQAIGREDEPLAIKSPKQLPGACSNGHHLQIGMGKGGKELETPSSS